MGKPAKKPQPPDDLTPEARAIWLSLQEEYDIVDGADLRNLEVAARCWDLERRCMRQALQDGLVNVDRYGQKRPHPMLSCARDARGQLLTALRQLPKKFKIQPFEMESR
jgi:phage terminase small subunit